MKNKTTSTPDSFIVQVPAGHVKRSLFGKPKVEKLVDEWAAKGYRLQSMTPVYAFWFPDRVTGYALNFHKA